MKKAVNTTYKKTGFPQKKPVLNQVTLSLMENLEQLIKIPLQDAPLEDLIPEPEGFYNSCNGAKDYLVRVRQESREPKESKDFKIKPAGAFPSPLCKHLLTIMKTFLDESVGKILANWEKTLGKGSTTSFRIDNTKFLLQISVIGFELLHSALYLLQEAVTKKEKVWEEMTRLVAIIRKLKEIILTKPSLVLLGEYQTILGETEHMKEGERIIQIIENSFKEAGRLVFILKKTNQLADLTDSLFNTLEIAMLEFIDSMEVSHNVIGFEIAMTIFSSTDGEYHTSLLTVILTWNKKNPLGNIGRFYQILFMYTNESVRETILGEVEKLDLQEMLHFLELFDTKMYEGFLEGGLLFQEENKITHKPSFLKDKLGLSANTITKLQNIVNPKVYEDLMKASKTFKLSVGKDGKERKKFIELLKIASICVRNPIFSAEKTDTKIQETLLQIINTYLLTCEPNKTHYTHIQIIIDIFLVLLKDMKARTFEQIMELTERSVNNECYLFSTKFGDVVQQFKTDEDTSHKMVLKLLEKLNSIYNHMLKSEDFLSKFKAFEGMMLTTNNSKLEKENLSVIGPEREEDKELFRKVSDPKHDLGKKLGGQLCKEMVGMVGGRLSTLQEENKQSSDKFKRIGKEHPYDLGSSGIGTDDELDRAFKVVEDTIQKLKEGEQSPGKEYKKLQVKNKMSQLMGMFYNN